MATEPPRIVIIEDDENKHTLYRTAFENHGFSVTILRNADGDFVEWIAREQPDIISMDILMGSDVGPVERDGFEAMELLNADERTKDIPVIVLSNFTNEERVRRAIALGAVDYIIPQSFMVDQIPEHYVRYLRDRDRYQPWHKLYREG